MPDHHAVFRQRTVDELMLRWGWTREWAERQFDTARRGTDEGAKVRAAANVAFEQRLREKGYAPYTR